MKIKRIIEIEDNYEGMTVSETLHDLENCVLPVVGGKSVAFAIEILEAIVNSTPYDEAEVWRKSNELLKKRLTYLQAVETRPKDEWIEFADYVARNVVSEDFSEDVDFYAEVLCRKLVKLGLVKLDGDIYKYCGADMRKGGAE